VHFIFIYTLLGSDASVAPDVSDAVFRRTGLVVIRESGLSIIELELELELTYFFTCHFFLS